jgi:hypothetical protein
MPPNRRRLSGVDSFGAHVRVGRPSAASMARVLPMLVRALCPRVENLWIKTTVNSSEQKL